MTFALKTKKSAGVRVSGSVHRHIERANRSRGLKDWAGAASSYRAAVVEDPSLYHIWIQLGHAEKESGRLEEAEQAYMHAAGLRPTEGEPLLHVGHVRKLKGDSAGATRSYYSALQVDPANPDALAELHRVLARGGDGERAAIVTLMDRAMLSLPQTVAREERIAEVSRLLRGLMVDFYGAANHDRRVLSEAVDLLERLDARPEEQGQAGEQATFVFDASDLIGYYGHSRLPTGIQRVQIEAIRAAIHGRQHSVKICCFVDGRDEWLEVPRSLFVEIATLSLGGGDRADPAWLSVINRLHLTLALASPIDFPQGAYLVNLGTSWWLRNYFLFVRHAKLMKGIRYIPFVHDFIPVLTPEHCIRELTEDFITWAVGVFDHADHYLCNSEATKRDLLRVAKVIGHDIEPNNVTVVPLDADFRKSEVAALPREALRRWRLEREPYVLFVSTIESRKGHIVAMDAWLELIRRRGTKGVPRLVCVGNKGWLNDAVYQRLDQSPELRAKVTMLSKLSDDELTLLYRNCLFTIYPSLYEGWGLPITESLCHGKAVIAADSSSLPEAGGEFAIYVEAGSFRQLADAVDQLSRDTTFREELEQRIASKYRPRPWVEIAQQIEEGVISMAARKPYDPYATIAAPVARLGAYHSMARKSATRIWPGAGSAEIFRSGLEWHWPEANGCRVRGCGRLRIGVPDGDGTVRFYLLIENVGQDPCGWHLEVASRSPLSGVLASLERKWVSLDILAAPRDRVIELALSEIAIAQSEAKGAQVDSALSLCGFYVCASEDLTARSALLEAVALGNVADLDAYRESEDAHSALSVSYTLEESR